MDRIALYLQDTYDLRLSIETVKYAEKMGFEAVWQAECRMARDAIVPMSAYAAVTERIHIGSAVINNWSRNIGLLAATFVTLDDLAPDRISCGIGAWGDPLARHLGIDRKKPVTAMRETVTVLRRLLNMEEVTFEGEFIHVKDLKLDVEHGCCDPRQVPILIGATGDHMLELAGEIADGVILNHSVSPEYNDHALEWLDKGAQKSGRTLADIDRPQVIICSVDHDHEAAVAATRRVLCQYLVQQPRIAMSYSICDDTLQQIHAILGEYPSDEQIEAASQLVSADLVDCITASGTPEEVRDRVNAYRQHGCTCPILYPAGGDVKLLIDTFAPVAEAAN